MPKRTICIQSPCTIRAQHRSLVVESDKGSVPIPLKDIWILIIESHLARISVSALSNLADAGIATLICGKTHMPNGLYLPLGAHSRHAAIVEDQLLISKPLKKRLWQKIVTAKITNQASVLSLLGFKNEAEELKEFGGKVLSGDTNNREAVAATLYFKTLISNGTRRNSPEGILLDYGYSVLRAGIAREAVAGGWLVSRGIHHSNNLNAFNLVDDLIEAFRPVVDLLVFDELHGATELDTNAKHVLIELFEYSVLLGEKTYSVQAAISRMLETLKEAIVSGSAQPFLLPKIIKLQKTRVKEG